MRISYSALDTYKNCPQKYKFQEIDKIPAPKSREAIFGTLIHETLRFLHSKEPQIPTLEKVLNYFKDKWPDSQKANWHDDFEEQAYFIQGINMLTNYYKKTDFSKINVVDLESRFEVEIEDLRQTNAPEKHILVGKIDRIDKLPDGTYEVIDYKTTRKMPPQDQVNKNLQLSIYHLGLIKKWPHLSPDKIKLSLEYLKHGEKLSTQVSAEQINQTKEEILTTIDKIKSSDFHPQPGPLCDWCAYKSICPVWRHLYQKDQSPDDVEIKTIIKEYLAIKKDFRKQKAREIELKEKINQYCDVKGLERLFVDEGYVMRVPQVRFEYDMKQIKNLLEPQGLWEEILVLDMKKLQKVLKKLPQDLQLAIQNARSISKEFKVLLASTKPIKTSDNKNLELGE